MPPIALLTDFGTSDWFVACMKGAIVSINPQARIIDITHDIPPGNVRTAAFILKACYLSFPRGTIFVTVVDPGVGSQRKAILVQAGGYCFIGPDNGLFSYILHSHDDYRILSLDKREFFNISISPTFHGRDIFAPVAAHLSTGIDPQNMGTNVSEYSRLSWNEPEVTEKSVVGEFVYIDRYGNAISNIHLKHAQQLSSPPQAAVFKTSHYATLSTHYQQGCANKPIALFNSLDLLEIAINGGSAAGQFDISIGDPIELR